jgi:hypothetical protein
LVIVFLSVCFLGFGYSAAPSHSNLSFLPGPQTHYEATTAIPQPQKSKERSDFFLSFFPPLHEIFRHLIFPLHCCSQMSQCGCRRNPTTPLPMVNNPVTQLQAGDGEFVCGSPPFPMFLTAAFQSIFYSIRDVACLLTAIN